MKRKRKDRNIPLIQAHVKKPKRSERTDSEKEAVKVQWGLKRFLPPHAIEEDEATIHFHEEWLKLESKKIKQDSQRIKNLIGRTFPEAYPSQLARDVA
jgi:hypothetical protein